MRRLERARRSAAAPRTDDAARLYVAREVRREMLRQAEADARNERS
jgi:hypothetical protein